MQITNVQKYTSVTIYSKGSDTTITVSSPYHGATDLEVRGEGCTGVEERVRTIAKSKPKIKKLYDGI